MTWLLQRVLDLLELLVNWFYRRKYGALARRFGRGTAEDDGRRGLIILQIDGLSHATLQRALARGAMPHLRRMIERDGYRLERWWCGVPSSTPAVQGGILYGNNEGIPAFRWYEKASGKTLVAKHPRDARILQDRLSAGRVGLLEEGSSYVNIYDGGARQSLFTISALGGERFFENVRGLSFVMLLLFSPIRLLRLIKDVTLDFVRDLGQRLVGRFDTRVGRRRRPFSLLGSLFQIIASVVFRELQTFGVLLDIYRRVPAIYANFYGYDDVAHQLGTLDGETERVLRGIDGRIREIDAARRRFADRRPYDLFVLSDHGMSPCTPFQERYGETLGQFMASQVAKGHAPVELDETLSREWRTSSEARYLLEELEGISANLSWRSQRLAAVLGNFVARRIPSDDEHEYDLSRHRDLVLRNSGTVSLVYFPLAAHQMDLSEIELAYPGLLRSLVEHPGLGLVLGRERGEAMAMTVRGPRRLLNLDDPLLRDLLHNLPNRALAARQLARVACFANSGDLLLFGRWNARGQTIAFEPHWATHGGIGGEQNHPFLLLPPEIDWDASAIVNPEQLYPLFMARYGRGAGSGERRHLTPDT
jgi:hypothetical protein